MVTYFIILLIIAVAVAPLASALPTKAQRREARLRSYASSLGLLIKLEPIPAIPPRLRYEPASNLVAYRLRTSNVAEENSKQRLIVKLSEGWIDTETEREFLELATHNLAGAEIAVLDDGVATIFWDERGDETEVDELHRALQDLLRL